MSLTYNKKVPVCFTREEECMLDGQSKICNWLYNQLLAACQKDYKENKNALQLLEGRNLRNYGVSLKEKHLFLNTVFSSVLKDPAERLLKAFTSFFKGNTGYINSIMFLLRVTLYLEKNFLDVKSLIIASLRLVRSIKDAFGLTILILEQASPFGRMKRLICLLHRLPPKPRTASGFEWGERKGYGAINLFNFAELSRFE